MKFWQMTALTGLVLTLGGCFKSEAPKCSDKEVVQLVKQIYTEHIGELSKSNPMFMIFAAAIPKKIVKIDSARPVSYDEKIHLRQCKAQAYFDDNRTAPIEYTVQLDEKNSDQFYVELSFEFLQPLAQQGMMQQILKDKE